MKHLLTILLLLSAPLYADYVMLTDLGSSAQSVGRGQVEGFSDSSNAIFENPAGLSRISKTSLSVFSSTLWTK